MAVHGGYRHLKRLAAPVLMPIKRKGIKWVIRPSAGGHSLEKSVALAVILRDLVGVAKTAREARQLLNEGEVLIDNSKVSDGSRPVGLFDVLSIPKVKSSYQLLNVKSKLLPVAIDGSKASEKLCKVVGKKVLSKDKVQVALHDGRTVILDKKEDVYSTGDSVVIQLPSQKVLKHLKMEKGATCYVAIGKHSGKIAVLDAIEAKPFGIPSDAHLLRDGEKLITRRDYLFVVSKDFKI